MEQKIIFEKDEFDRLLNKFLDLSATETTMLEYRKYGHTFPTNVPIQHSATFQSHRRRLDKWLGYIFYRDEGAIPTIDTLSEDKEDAPTPDPSDPYNPEDEYIDDPYEDDIYEDIDGSEENGYL